MCAAALLDAHDVGAVAGAEAGPGAGALSHASQSVLAGEKPDTEEGVACVGCGGNGGSRVAGDCGASPDGPHGVGGV